MLTLTRDDVVTYGKSKQIILDLAAMPADDPRRSVTEEDMIAKAAADKIFELTV
jgi:hypothetical protein